MKTCGAILQTLKLMKGSLPLCSLHTYNECNAAIINFHLDASLISWSCFLEPKLTTGELLFPGILHSRQSMIRNPTRKITGI